MFNLDRTCLHMSRRSNQQLLSLTLILEVIGLISSVWVHVCKCHQGNLHPLDLLQLLLLVQCISCSDHQVLQLFQLFPTPQLHQHKDFHVKHYLQQPLWLMLYALMLLFSRHFLQTSSLAFCTPALPGRTIPRPNAAKVKLHLISFLRTFNTNICTIEWREWTFKISKSQYFQIQDFKLTNTLRAFIWF